MKTVLTIAGSDCSGGAGIQADIKTITVHKKYAMSVITALTAQNTMGVFGIDETSPEFVENQLNCIFNDIRPDAIKIGMVSNKEIIKVIAKKLRQEKVENIVVDPVMVATSGGKLIEDNTVETLKEELFPLAKIITPNIPEAEVLFKVAINNRDEMLSVMKKLPSNLSTAILVKGGHLSKTSDDLLLKNGNAYWFNSEHIETKNTHGTGCTLSSAIACNLADGLSVFDAVKKAKEYITGAIRANLQLGHGNGPLNHCWNLEKNN